MACPPEMDVSDSTFRPKFGSANPPQLRTGCYATLSALSPPVIQTNPVLRSIVLITESIFPLKTCLARLRVKPVTVRKGR
jgi:hypothetical protein